MKLPMNAIELAAAEHKRIHFIGIGGIMMSALALEMKRRGANVTGNDREDGPATAMLRNAGISVEIGHEAAFVEGADLIVRNAAIKDSSPDIKRARELGLQILERPDVLGRIMDEYEIPVGISGTHGKSTASGMLTHALIKGGYSPTSFLGATLPEAGAAFTLGEKKWFVAESCEYCESFLYLYPKVAVILNVETDHLDYFSGLPHIISAFGKFALNTPADGVVVVNADNKNAMSAVLNLPRRIITFGVENGDVQARDLFVNSGYYGYDLFYDGVRLGRIKLSVPGLHNVSNSLAVAAAMIAGNAKTADIIGGISDFTGMRRRFERVGEYNGALLIDDYAHHPDELRATLNTARSMGFDRVVCLFQPHTYTRTKALLPDFGSALCLADLVALTDIYSAREQNTTGISSKDISDLVPGSVYIPELSDAADYLASVIKKGDIVITCGAGSVGQVAHELARRQAIL